MDEAKLTASIQSAEGYRAMMYDDATGLTFRHGTAPSGTLTVGWGHNCEMAFPIDVLRALLESDIAIARQNVMACFPTQFDAFSDARQRALVEMCFNIGARSFNQFEDMIKYIKIDGWSGAAVALMASDYARQLPVRVARLAFMLAHGVDSLTPVGTATA